jgi:hypothetical protein
MLVTPSQSVKLLWNRGRFEYLWRDGFAFSAHDARDAAYGVDEDLFLVPRPLPIDRTRIRRKSFR